MSLSARALFGVRRYNVHARRPQQVLTVYQQTPRLIHGKISALKVEQDKLFAKFDPSGEKRRLFDRRNPLSPLAGDIMRVTKKDKTSFVGMLIALNRSSLGTTILLRTKITGVGVENRFHVYSPDVEKIEILRVPVMRWPRQKYYFIRGLKDNDTGDLEALMRRQRRNEAENAAAAEAEAAAGSVQPAALPELEELAGEAGLEADLEQLEGAQKDSTKL